MDGTGVADARKRNSEEVDPELANRAGTRLAEHYKQDLK
jgi:hypothetical protein